MNGPEHYEAAELLLNMSSDDLLGGDAERFHIAKAHVHATLALAAATVQEAVSLYTGASDDLVAWGNATAPATPAVTE